MNGVRVVSEFRRFVLFSAFRSRSMLQTGRGSITTSSPNRVSGRYLHASRGNQIHKQRPFSKMINGHIRVFVDMPDQFFNRLSNAREVGFGNGKSYIHDIKKDELTQIRYEFNAITTQLYNELENFSSMHPEQREKVEKSLRVLVNSCFIVSDQHNTVPTVRSVCDVFEIEEDRLFNLVLMSIELEYSDRRPYVPIDQNNLFINFKGLVHDQKIKNTNQLFDYLSVWVRENNVSLGANVFDKREIEYLKRVGVYSQIEFLF